MTPEKNQRFRVSRATFVPSTQTWEIEQVNRSWCFRYGLMVEADLATDGTRIDHYDPENPCPGPHGEMYAAVGPGGLDLVEEYRSSSRIGWAEVDRLRALLLAAGIEI